MFHKTNSTLPFMKSCYLLLFSLLSLVLKAQNIHFYAAARSLYTDVKKHFPLNKYQVWTDKYPKDTSAYWDDASMAWGQGAMFSAFVAYREASMAHHQKCSSKEACAIINKFLTKQGGIKSAPIKAFAVYPQDGNERFYDDNLWIGIAFADLYKQTKFAQNLNEAILVWNFVEKGIDKQFGGGVYWKEGDSTKNTCSNAPAIVLALKLYAATHNHKYLQIGRDLYQWTKDNLLDTTDQLYWDNIRKEKDFQKIVIGKEKYTYNTGEMMEAAALLFQSTQDSSYLMDAQKMRASFIAHFSKEVMLPNTKTKIRVIDPSGHVWFKAIALRGVMALYSIDKDSSLLSLYKQTLATAWHYARQKNAGLLNTDVLGLEKQSSWELLQEAAYVEMLSNLSLL